MANPVPIPVNDPIAKPRRPGIPAGQKDPNEGLVSDTWAKYLTFQADVTTAAPARVAAVQLTAQAASIGATALPVAQVNTGLYRVTYYARITVPATVSSSLTFALGFTDGGVSVTLSGAAMTANTVSTAQSGTQLITVDSNSPITYSTTYASVGATPMAYKLSVILEAINA